MFNVYLPTDQHSYGFNMCVLQDVLSEISSVCIREDAKYIILIGDFNTDFSRVSVQTDELNQFCENEMLRPCIFSGKSEIVYTFENALGARSLIDHCLVSHNLSDYLCKYSVYDSVNNSSDHLCILSVFKIDCNYVAVQPQENLKRVVWHKATVSDINKYKNCIDSKLKH